MTTSSNVNNITPALQPTIGQLINEFDLIPERRKKILDELTHFVSQQVRANQPALLNFICTHNSRRSHISQLWAQTAATYYGIHGVQCYSGGTEATAFNPRAVKAMQDAGFDIQVFKNGTNPIYKVRFSKEVPAVTVFSKKYDDESNPQKDFAAIMTCSHADEHCPIVTGASKRIALTYNDPKDFDGTPQEAAKYAERVHEIGREILYAFSRVK